MYSRELLTCLLLGMFLAQAWADCGIVEEFPIPPISTIYNASELLVAALGENTTEMAELIENGCDVNYAKMTEQLYPQDEPEKWISDTSVLHLVARAGSVGALQVLLKHPELDLEARDGIGRTPIFRAAVWGRYDVVKILHNAGADVNATDYEFGTPLFYAATYGYADTVLTLIELGADMNARGGPYCLTTLHIAVALGYTDTVEVLIEAGADLNLTDAMGWTPLDVAINFEFPDVQEMLEAAGAERGLGYVWYDYQEEDYHGSGEGDYSDYYQGSGSGDYYDYYHGSGSYYYDYYYGSGSGNYSDYYYGSGSGDDYDYNYGSGYDYYSDNSNHWNYCDWI